MAHKRERWRVRAPLSSNRTGGSRPASRLTFCSPERSVPKSVLLRRAWHSPPLGAFARRCCQTGHQRSRPHHGAGPCCWPRGAWRGRLLLLQTNVKPTVLADKLQVTITLQLCFVTGQCNWATPPVAPRFPALTYCSLLATIFP